MADDKKKNNDQKKSGNSNGSGIPKTLERQPLPELQEDRLKSMHSTLQNVQQIENLPEYEEFKSVFARDPAYRRQFHEFLVNNQRMGVISDVPEEYQQFEQTFLPEPETDEEETGPDAAVPAMLRRSNMELESAADDALASTENLDHYDSTETLQAKKLQDAAKVLTERGRPDQYQIRDSARLQALREEEQELLGEQEKLEQQRQTQRDPRGQVSVSPQGVPMYSPTGQMIEVLPEEARQQMNDNEQRIQKIRETKNFILQRKEDEFKEEFDALKRLGFNLQKGMKQVKAGAKGMRVADLAEDIEAMRALDQGKTLDNVYNARFGAMKPKFQKYQKASPEEKVKMKQEALSKMADNITEIMDLQNTMQEIPTNPFAEEMIQAEDADQAWDIFKESPVDIIGSLGITSLPFSTASMAGGIIGGLTAGPPGAVAGIGLGSGSMEYMASLTEGMMREVEKKGYSQEDYLRELEKAMPGTDPESVSAQQFFNSKEFQDSLLKDKLMEVAQDPKAMDRVKNYATKRGVAIGALDAAGSFVPVKGITNQVIKQGAKGAINTSKIAGLTGLGIAVDASAGGLGEALAQLVTDGEIHAGEVSAELVGELIGGPAEIGGATAASIYNELGYEGFRDLVRGEIRKLRKGKPGQVEIKEGIGYQFNPDADLPTQQQQLEAERLRLQNELKDRTGDDASATRIALSDLEAQLNEIDEQIGEEISEEESEQTEEKETTEQTEEEETEIETEPIEIRQPPEEAAPTERMDFLQQERERLRLRRAESVAADEPTEAIDEAISSVTEQIQPVLSEVRSEQRAAAAQEGTVEDVLGQQVEMGEYQGELTQDEEGNIIIDTGDQIVEVPDSQKDIGRPLADLGLSRVDQPIRGFRPTEDEDVYELVERDPLGFDTEQTEPFVFKSANTNEAGEVVSVTMTNAQGQERTFRDPAQVEQVIWDQYFKRGTPVEDLGSIIDEQEKEASTEEEEAVTPVIPDDETSPEEGKRISRKEFDRRERLFHEENKRTYSELPQPVNEVIEQTEFDESLGTFQSEQDLTPDQERGVYDYAWESYQASSSAFSFSTNDFVSKYGHKPWPATKTGNSITLESPVDGAQITVSNLSDQKGQRFSGVPRITYSLEREFQRNLSDEGITGITETDEGFTLDETDPRIDDLFGKVNAGEQINPEEFSAAREWIQENREAAVSQNIPNQNEILQFLTEIENDLQQIEQQQQQEQQQESKEEDEAEPTEDEVPEPPAESEEEGTGQDEQEITDEQVQALRDENIYSEEELAVVRKYNLTEHIDAVEQEIPASQTSQYDFYRAVQNHFNTNEAFPLTIDFTEEEELLFEQVINKYHYLTVAEAVENGEEVSDYALRDYQDLLGATSTIPAPEGPPETLPKEFTRGITREEFRQQLQDLRPVQPDFVIDAILDLIDTRAQIWAKNNDRSINEYYKLRLAGIRQNPPMNQDEVNELLASYGDDINSLEDVETTIEARLSEPESNYANRLTGPNGQRVNYNSARQMGLFEQSEEEQMDMRLAGLRPLEESEFAYMEREYSPSRDWNFFKPMSFRPTADHIAFMFGQLENTSVEHSFLVGVDANNEPHILHVGTGAKASTVVDTTPVINFVQNFGIKKIWFVHNHPSGRVENSRADQSMISKIFFSLPEGVEMGDGVIIDRDSGFYGRFNLEGFVGDEYIGTLSVREGIEDVDHPVETLNFSRFKFLKGNERPSLQITSPDAAAAFVNTRMYSLGEDQYSAVILDHAKQVVAFVHMKNKPKDIAGAGRIAQDDFTHELQNYISRFNGESAVLVTKQPAANMESKKPYLRGLKLAINTSAMKLDDVLFVQPGTGSLSAFNSMAAEGYFENISHKNTLAEPVSIYNAEGNEQSYSIDELAIIDIFEKDPTADTEGDDIVGQVVKQLAPVFYRDLQGEHFEAVRKHLGAEGRQLTKEQAQQLGNDFATYLATNKKPPKNLQSVFEAFKQWLVNIYYSLRGSDAATIPNDVRAAFDSLFKDTTEDLRNTDEKLAGKVIKGKEVNVSFRADGSETIPGYFALVEARDLQGSHNVDGSVNQTHFIGKAQPRDRRSKKYLIQHQQVAQNLNPVAITGDEKAFYGAPTVNARIEAIQGNGRSIAMKMAYIEYPKSIARYKAYLEEHAEEFGFTANDVYALDNPVMVKIIPVQDKEAIRLGNLKNVDEIRMDKKEEALSSVRNMSMEDKKKVGYFIKESEADTFRAVLDEYGFEILNLIPDINVADYSDDGRITVEGKDFLTDVFRALMFESESGNSALQAFNVMHDDVIKGIEKSYGILLPLRGTSADLAPLLQQAVRIVDEIKKTKGIKNVKDFKSQGDAFEGYNVDRFSETEFQMAQVIMDVTRPSSPLMKNLGTTGTQKALQLLIQDYENKIYGETNLFGTTEPRNTPEGAQETFEEVFTARLSPEQQQSGETSDEPPAADDEGGLERNNVSMNTAKLHGFLDEEQTLEADTKQDISWLEEDPVTKKGQKLVGRIKNDPHGDKIGIRSVINFINDELNVEVRIGKEQTTRRNPGHLSTRELLIRSRYPLHSLMFHEAGHAISKLLRKESPARTDNLNFEFYYDRPGSMASARSDEEGWAEWVRLYIKNPEWSAARPETAQVESLLADVAPDVLKLLQDTARAYRAHISRGTAAIFRSSNKDFGPSRDSLVFRAKEFLYDVLFKIGARNWAITKFENQAIYKPFVEAAETKREGRRLAAELLGKHRMSPADFRLAHQVTNRIPQEVEYALNGFKGQGGIRAYSTMPGRLFSEAETEALEEAGFTVTDSMSDPDMQAGTLVNFTDITVESVVKKIGDERWDDFETYAQAKVSLDRVLKKSAKYPGWEAAEPRDLLNVVEQYEDQHEDFAEAFDQLNEFMDSLLLVAVAGGDKTVQEAVAMKTAYDHYLPLPRRIERGKNSIVKRNRGTVDAGFRGIKGTGDIPIMPLIEAIEGRVFQVIEAYYTNRAMLAPYRLAEEIQQDPDVPDQVKYAVSRFMVPLKLDRKKVATLSEQEMQEVIADYLNQQRYEELLQELGPEAMESGMFMFPEVKPDEVNVAFPSKGIWRQVKPDAVNVIAAKINGETRYFQVEDPVLYNYFAMSDQPSSGVNTLFNTILAKMTAPWKRILTQVISFAVRNTLARDPATAIFFGLPPEFAGDISKTEAVKHMVPGYFTVTGLYEMFTNRDSDPVQHGELLSRSMSRTMSPAQKARSTEFQKVLKEGIVISGYTNLPARQKLAEIPGIAMSALLKPLELIFHYTGMTYISQMGEESNRIGAYKAAKKAGMSDEAAMLAYDLITGNFAERPGSPTAYSIYRSAGFLNPAVQIFSEQLRRVISADPNVRSKTITRYGFIGASTIAIWAINRLMTPEDRWEELKYRTDDEKLRYIPMFGQLRVPFDYGPIGALQSFSYNMMDNLANEQDIDSRKLATDVLKKMIELPVTPDAMINPQVMSLIEAEANYKFYFNEPIVPGFLSELPADLQVYTMTPGFYRRVAELRDVSPLKVQHVVRNAMGASMDEAISFTDRVVNGERIERHQWPFVGRLFQRTPSGWYSQPAREVSDLNAEYDAAVRRYKNMTPEQAERNPEEVEKLKEIFKRLKPMNDAMNVLQKQYELVKHYREQEEWEMAKEAERKMTEYAASVLSASGMYESSEEQ